MLKVPVPSNASDPSVGSPSSEAGGSVGVGGGGDVGVVGDSKKKKRRWAVCKAKVKAGVLKVRALVDSDSSDSGSYGSDSGTGSSSRSCSGSRSGGDGEDQSDSGVDPGFGDDGRPFPMKVQHSRYCCLLMVPPLEACPLLLVLLSSSVGSVRQLEAILGPVCS